MNIIDWNTMEHYFNALEDEIAQDEYELWEAEENFYSSLMTPGFPLFEKPIRTRFPSPAANRQSHSLTTNPGVCFLPQNHGPNPGNIGI
jgi:hypothetical protein